MITTLTLPFFTGYVDKAEQKRQIVSILTAIKDIRKRAISYMVVGEISVEGRDLVFYLDNREFRRLPFVQRPYMQETIIYNRNGIASGGEIIVTLDKRYIIVVEPVSGKVHMNPVGR